MFPPTGAWQLRFSAPMLSFFALLKMAAVFQWYSTFGVGLQPSGFYYMRSAYIYRLSNDATEENPESTIICIHLFWECAAFRTVCNCGRSGKVGG